MLGQTNTSGGNTSELELAVANLTSNMYELNDRMNEIDEANRKYYLTISPFPATSSSYIKTHDDKYPDNLSGDAGFDLYVDGELKSKYPLSGMMQYTGLSSTTSILVPNGTVANITFHAIISTSTMYSYIKTINVYKFGTKVFTQTATSGDSKTCNTDSISVTIDKNTRIFRSTYTSSSSTLNLYIEEYTP